MLQVLPCGVVIAGRMEIGQQTGRDSDGLSAAQEVQQNYGIPVAAIASLDDLLFYLRGNAAMMQNLQAVQAYRDRYGIGKD